MADFIDYMQFLTTAENLGALESQIVRSVGSASVALDQLPAAARESRSDAESAWSSLDKPTWVQLASQGGIGSLARAGKAYHIQVEHDRQTWALAVNLEAQNVVLAFLAQPGAPRLATVQYADTQVYDPLGNDVELAQIAEYFGVGRKALEDTFVPDGGQAFSALIGAPYEQMEDLTRSAPERGQVVFPFE